MEHKIRNEGTTPVQPIKSTRKTEKSPYCQNLKPQSKFNKLYHDELKKRGICQNL